QRPIGGLIAAVFAEQLFATAAGGLIAIAGLSLRRLEFLRLTLAGCVLAVLPLSLAWPAGLAAGLWALMVARSPDVRSSFGRVPVGPAAGYRPGKLGLGAEMAA